MTCSHQSQARLQCRHLPCVRECFVGESAMLKLEKRGENGAAIFTLPNLPPS